MLKFKIFYKNAIIILQKVYTILIFISRIKIFKQLQQQDSKKRCKTLYTADISHDVNSLSFFYIFDIILIILKATFFYHKAVYI